jgi:kanamycin kinase
LGWLHTARLTGRSAVDSRWADDPRTAARAIGDGLRRLHDALPVDDCPFERPSWVPDDAPPADRLVVCHGDACSPNTLLTDDGTFSGHVDLGDLGVADRWADLAIATLSLDWNFPTEGAGGFQEVLLDAYGVTADVDRIAYYRLAWDASDDDQDPLAG